MADQLEQFAQQYASRMRSYAEVVSVGAVASIPRAIKAPAFVISCTASTQSCFVALFSAQTTPHVDIGGRRVCPDPSGAPTFIHLTCNGGIEVALFPPAAAGRAQPQLHIAQRYVVLNGLAFASADFNAKHWATASFARLVGADIPFTLSDAGSVLVIDLLYGFEERGVPRQIHYELLSAFGSLQMLPESDHAISDMAFRDFAIATTRKTPLSTWSFRDYLQSLQGPVERNVLVLGPYRSEYSGRFEELLRVLHGFHWQPLQLRDADDVPIQSNFEKFVAGLMCARFVVVIDDAASGHIAELTLLLQLRWRPVIVLRSSSAPSTTFLEDKIRTDEMFRIAEVEPLTADGLAPHIEWALRKATEQIDAYNTINSWR